MIKPYYETKLGKLYHGDCLEIMPQLEPVDLVLTDPPYGLTDWNNRGTNKKGPFDSEETQLWDKPIDKKTIELLFKFGKHQIIWGANHFLELLKNTKQLFIWNKKLRGMHFNDCEIAWCSQFREACRIFDFHPALNSNKKHPTQKPLELFMWCIFQAQRAINIISIGDPFLGSGTTAIACERLKIKWIGIEISEKYCEIAAKRIEENLTVMERIERSEKGITKKTGLLF